MTNDEMRQLQRGDLVRHKADIHAYLVQENYGDRVVAVKAVELTNASEWELIAKAEYTRKGEFQ